MTLAHIHLVVHKSQKDFMLKVAKKCSKKGIIKRKPPQALTEMIVKAVETLNAQV